MGESKTHEVQEERGGNEDMSAEIDFSKVQSDSSAGRPNPCVAGLVANSEYLSEGVARAEGRIQSSDGASRLRVLTWIPLQGEFRGIVQIVHGMAEHVGRYEGFACVLARAGFLVVGEDHVGHGESVGTPDKLGHLPLNGADVLVNDANYVGRLYRAAYPELPFFLFGHSMGSFIARRYCAEFGSELDGAILCGTGSVPLAVSKAANALCKMLARTKGPEYRSEKIDALGAGGYAKGIPDAQDEYDWLSVNRENVLRYRNDPLCGALFSVGGYAALTALTAEVVTLRHARRVPSGLPMLFVSGGMDPVGECGKGVVEACELYREAGVLDCRMRLYPGLRHEILNEDAHEEVEADILGWIESHLPKKEAEPESAGAEAESESSTSSCKKED